MTDETMAATRAPRPAVLPEGAATLRPGAADALRQMIAQDSRPEVGARPEDAATVVMSAQDRVAQIERGRVLGDVVWVPGSDQRLVTLTNGKTGGRWVRNAVGDWRQDPPPLPVAQQIAALLRRGADQADAVAVLLRRDIRPWQELLDGGAAAAWESAGDVEAVRLVQRETARLMQETARLPHRIAMVVDDADAYAASWYADASIASDAAWAHYCRHQADSARKSGAGRVPAGTYRSRQEAVLQLVTFRGGERPGASWRIDPVRDGAR